MLLDFKGSNFKSFGYEYDFFMQPELRLTELKYSILEKEIEGKSVKALSSSVIYGPNAAGKTSIINAMSCLKQIIIRGNIKDAQEDRMLDHVSDKMYLIPFRFHDNIKPVTFDVSFINNERKYRYTLSFYVGAFLQRGFKRYIDNEELFVNDNLVFRRNKEDVSELDTTSIKDVRNIGYEDKDDEKNRLSMGNNMTYDSLLLSTDFNSFCSKTIVSEIIDWFTHKFIVVNASNRGGFYPIFDKDHTAMTSSVIDEIAKEAGIVGDGFVYVSGEDDEKPRLISVLKKNENSVSGIEASEIESVGTLRLIAILPAILRALKDGLTLVVDEFDASLHPSIVMNIISVFHNDEVNKNGAQLIFNTHNPMYLNNKLLRRDEIKFVERDDITKSAQLYALSDFKTNSGETSVRKTSDYMKNYFVNRYGAILDVDFTDLILDFLNTEEEKANA